MLHDELKQGTVVFTVQEDGSETVAHRPPTARDLRVARELETLHQQAQQLMGAYQQLQNQYQQLDYMYQNLLAQHTKVEPVPTPQQVVEPAPPEAVTPDA